MGLYLVNIESIVAVFGHQALEKILSRRLDTITPGELQRRISDARSHGTPIFAICVEGHLGDPEYLSIAQQTRKMRYAPGL